MLFTTPTEACPKVTKFVSPWTFFLEGMTSSLLVSFVHCLFSDSRMHSDTGCTFLDSLHFSFSNFSSENLDHQQYDKCCLLKNSYLKLRQIWMTILLWIQRKCLFSCFKCALLTILTACWLKVLGLANKSGGKVVAPKN